MFYVHSTVPRQVHVKGITAYEDWRDSLCSLQIARLRTRFENTNHTRIVDGTLIAEPEDNKCNCGSTQTVTTVNEAGGHSPKR